MKMFKKILICAIVLVCFITITLLPVNASTTPLDEIQDYTITVNMRPDGTMDIKYHVEWKVLDDSREGPLEWVKIGNPNKHVDGITALSDNIKDINYVSVKYNLDAFTTNENEQYTEDAGSSGTGGTVLIVVLVIIGVLLLIVFLVSLFGDDDYGSHGGFGGGRSTIFVSHSSCARSSCACASCACACACAGDGRAGCSKKDFYKTNLKIDVIKSELERKEW